MANIHHAREPWQHNFIVVEAETIVFGGESVPLTITVTHVEGRRITNSTFIQVAWAIHFDAIGHKSTKEEVEQALATIRPPVRTSPATLRQGTRPYTAFEFAGKVFQAAAQSGGLIVTHDPGQGLTQIFAATEAFLDTDLPPVNVVSTAVLERARRAGQRPFSGESPAEFYRRIAEADGELPDLRDCCRDQGLWDGLPRPKDHLFPASATFAIYQKHLDMHLPGAEADGVEKLRRC
jgi:hypothetical protein